MLLLTPITAAVTRMKGRRQKTTFPWPPGRITQSIPYVALGRIPPTTPPRANSATAVDAKAVDIPAPSKSVGIQPIKKYRIR